MLRPGYIQIRVTDLKAALTHYVDRVGLHEVSREADGRVHLRAWDEFVANMADPFGNGFDLIEFSGPGYDNLQR